MRSRKWKWQFPIWFQGLRNCIVSNSYICPIHKELWSFTNRMIILGFPLTYLYFFQMVIIVGHKYLSSCLDPTTSYVVFLWASGPWGKIIDILEEQWAEKVWESLLWPLVAWPHPICLWHSPAPCILGLAREHCVLFRALTMYPCLWDYMHALLSVGNGSLLSPLLTVHSQITCICNDHSTIILYCTNLLTHMIFH